MNFENTATKIELLCRQRGVSVNKMLTDSGASKNLLLNMRNGSSPNITSLLQVANYFGVSMDYLLEVSNAHACVDHPINPLDVELVKLCCKLGDEQKKAVVNLLKTLLQDK